MKKKKSKNFQVTTTIPMSHRPVKCVKIFFKAKIIQFLISEDRSQKHKGTKKIPSPKNKKGILISTKYCESEPAFASGTNNIIVNQSRARLRRRRRLKMENGKPTRNFH